MIYLTQYETVFPALFAASNNRNSPTYTRKSKTGKVVVVRKGKRNRKKLLINTGLATGAIVGSVLAGNKIRNLSRHNKMLLAKIKDDGIEAAKRKTTIDKLSKSLKSANDEISYLMDNYVPGANG